MVADVPRFACACGDEFRSARELMDHKIHRHDMTPEDSRRHTMDQYPQTMGF